MVGLFIDNDYIECYYIYNKVTNGVKLCYVL